MEETVGYAGETPFTMEGDWRWQETVNMSPQVVMDELLSLSEEIQDSKSTWEETKFELRQARERLKLMEAQVLQAALNSEDKVISDQVSGKNAEVRQRKAAVYLADHLTVKDLAHELRAMEALEVEARLAMEAVLDRQKNVHQWARMFEAQVKLLSTVRAPESSLEEVGHILAKAYREPILEDEALATTEMGGVRHLYAQIIRTFASEPESAIHPAISSVYDDARAWMQWWFAEAIGPPPVDTGDLVEKIVQISKSGQAPPDLEPEQIAAGPCPPQEEIFGSPTEGMSGPVFPSDEVEIPPGKAAIDELFPPDVTIPPSMNVSEEEVDAFKAAVGRYQDEPSDATL